MSEHKHDRKALALFFGLIGLLVLSYVVTSTLMLVLPSTSLEWFLSYVGLLFSGILVIILIAPISMAGFKLRNDAREHSIRQQHPTALVAHIVTAKGFTKELRALAGATGVPRPKIRRNSYATMALDDATLRLFVGGRTARQEFEVPLAQLASAELELLKAPKPVPSIALRFTTSAGELPLSLIPLYQPGIMAKPLPEQTVNDLLARLRAHASVA